MRKALLPLAVLVATSVAAPVSAFAAHEELLVTGLAQNGKLVTFQADTGERLSQTKKVSGIAAGYQLVSIDYRPATGVLYGVATNGTSGLVYTIDPTSAAAAQVGTAFPITGDVSIDFNPAADRLRVVSTDDQNLRLNVDPGTFAVITDGALNYTAGGADPSVVGVAYVNNDRSAATGTQLFDVDSVRDALALQDPPNAGGLVQRGTLGTDLGTDTGFDVYSERNADGAATSNVALLTDRDADGTRVSVVNLTSGAVNPASTVLVQGSPVRDIAVDPNQ